MFNKTKTLTFRYADGRIEKLKVRKSSDFSAYQTYQDGAIMLDEDEKLVTKAFYETQRPVAERVAEIYQETHSLFQAAIVFGEEPAWAESILRRYDLLPVAA